MICKLAEDALHIHLILSVILYFNFFSALEYNLAKRDLHRAELPSMVSAPVASVRELAGNRGLQGLPEKHCIRNYGGGLGSLVDNFSG